MFNAMMKALLVLRTTTARRLVLHALGLAIGAGLLITALLFASLGLYFLLVDVMS